MSDDPKLDDAWEQTLARLPDASDLRNNAYHLARSRELFEAGWRARAAQEQEQR